MKDINPLSTLTDHSDISLSEGFEPIQLSRANAAVPTGQALHPQGKRMFEPWSSFGAGKMDGIGSLVCSNTISVFCTAILVRSEEDAENIITV